MYLRPNLSCDPRLGAIRGGTGTVASNPFYPVPVVRGGSGSGRVTFPGHEPPRLGAGGSVPPRTRIAPGPVSVVRGGTGYGQVPPHVKLHGLDLLPITGELPTPYTGGTTGSELLRARFPLSRPPVVYGGTGYANTNTTLPYGGAPG